MKFVKSKFSVVALIISSSFGLMLAASIGFHIGLLQELTFSNKLIFIALLSIPLIWLFFFLLTRFCKKIKRVRLLLPTTISIIVTTLIMTFVYQEIKPLQSHSFQLHLPEQTTEGAIVSLSKVYTKGILTKEISIDSLEFTGPVNHAKYMEVNLLRGSTTTLTQVFSGDLHLVLEPTECPLYANTLLDEKKTTINLCDLNSDGELIFSEGTNGITSPKWKLTQKIFTVIDSFLMLTLVFSFSYIAEFETKLLKNKNSDKSREQLLFFFTSLFSAIFITVLIIWAQIPDLEIFIPIIVLLAGYQLYTLCQKTAWNNFIEIILLVLIIICGIFVNLQVERTNYFMSLDASLEPTNNDRGNSFNSLVTSILKPLPYSLFYGFGEILINRELVTSQEIISNYNIDTALVEKLLRDHLRIDDENKYSLTDIEYTCILNKPHFDWITYQNNRIASLTEEYYLGDEPAILVQYNETLFLLPESFFSGGGTCQ